MFSSIPTIQPQEVLETQKSLPGNYTLIDVRMPDEFNGELGHIEGAKLVTLGPELSQFLASGDRNQSIIFICRSGKRSENATREALKLGYIKVFNMVGGMIAWRQL